MTQQKRPASRVKWRDLPKELRGEILRLIDEGMNAPPIYERLIEGRYDFSIDKLQRVATRRRKRVKPDRSFAIKPPSADSYNMVLSAALDRIATGEAKSTEYSSLLRILHDNERLQMEREVHGKVQEEFDLKLRKMGAEVDAAFDAVDREEISWDDARYAIRAVYGLGGDDDGDDVS